MTASGPIGASRVEGEWQMPPPPLCRPPARGCPVGLLATRSALTWDHGRNVAARAAALGVTVVELPNDRLALDLPDDPRQSYAEAKRTLALVVAPPSKRRLQPIAPSADWRVDLAEGCPAHCSYCYLAGSLSGPPITRVYANLPEIFAELPKHLGAGRVTSRSRARAHEGTTYEASCYTDPLALEHLTGSLSALITNMGEWEADVQLRFTSKFAQVEPLLGLPHAGRTRNARLGQPGPLRAALRAAPAPWRRGSRRSAVWPWRATRSG
jgi:spore photoproduct lyase